MTGILVFAPHPDDETLGCGGSVAHHIAVGRRVNVAFMTSGEQRVADGRAERSGPVREQEAETALGKLGVGQDVHFLRLPDGGLDPMDRDQFLQVLHILRHLRPSVVYLPHAQDASFDHRQAFQLAWRALEKCASRSYPHAGQRHWVGTVLAYEVWSPLPAPSYLQRLDPAQIAVKHAALSCYSTQVKGEGEADYAGEGGVALARFRGAMSVGGHCEAFAVLRLASPDWAPQTEHSSTRAAT